MDTCPEGHRGPTPGPWNHKFMVPGTTPGARGQSLLRAPGVESPSPSPTGVPGGARGDGRGGFFGLPTLGGPGSRSARVDGLTGPLGRIQRQGSSAWGPWSRWDVSQAESGAVGGGLSGPLGRFP
ncbi:PREDICTED: collagen alpha-1(II) chain-like, partial [Vollenhovia emeryi]|uniref:collagen alpha-1(II) chain-like n=1 Tax=Vollenhovia emeryi TaxID=411798 RepID=UPI0005F41B3B